MGERVRNVPIGAHGGVEAIGHIVKDDWFEPRKYFMRSNARIKRRAQHVRLNDLFGVTAGERRKTCSGKT